MTTSFTDRARKGITTLEAYEPGCTDRIVLKILNVYDLNRCPLAQALGDDFGESRIRLGLPPDDDVWAGYGFSLTVAEHDADMDDGYEQLRQAWITELTAHRTAKENRHAG